LMTKIGSVLSRFFWMWLISSEWFCRRVLGLRLREIGEKFGLGYTGVIRCVSDMKRKVEEDLKFRKKVEKIVANSKVKTWYLLNQ